MCDGDCDRQCLSGVALKSVSHDAKQPPLLKPFEAQPPKTRFHLMLNNGISATLADNSKKSKRQSISFSLASLPSAEFVIELFLFESALFWMCF